MIFAVVVAKVVSPAGSAAKSFYISLTVSRVAWAVIIAAFSASRLAFPAVYVPFRAAMVVIAVVCSSLFTVSLAGKARSSADGRLLSHAGMEFSLSGYSSANNLLNSAAPVATQVLISEMFVSYLVIWFR